MVPLCNQNHYARIEYQLNSCYFLDYNWFFFPQTNLGLTRKKNINNQIASYTNILHALLILQVCSTNRNTWNQFEISLYLSFKILGSVNNAVKHRISFWIWYEDVNGDLPFFFGRRTWRIYQKSRSQVSFKPVSFQNVLNIFFFLNVRFTKNVSKNFNSMCKRHGKLFDNE